MQKDYFIQLSTSLRRGKAIRKLRGSPLTVWLAIALHVGTDGRAYPSENTIAEISGYSVDTVKRCIGKLIANGMLIKERQGGWHRGSNLYRIPGYARFGYSPEPVEVGVEVDEMQLQGVTSAPLVKGAPMHYKG
jgi:hypothetical protein